MFLLMSDRKFETTPIKIVFTNCYEKMPKYMTVKVKLNHSKLA